MYGKDYDKDRGFANKDFPIWVAEKIKKTFYNFYEPLYSNDNIICSKKEYLKGKYKEQDIFIFGGGGSTNRYLKDDQTLLDIQNYDSFWSLNYFYKNKILQNYPLELISLGPEVDFQDKDLEIYLQSFQPDVGIELHQKWSREKIDHPLVKEVNDFYNYKEKFCFQTRYFTILGSGARLVLLACELEVKSISIIGFDGPQNIWAGNHSFEEGKNFMTYRCQGYPKEQVIKMFENEYNFFWNYCKQVYPNTKIYALDDYYRYHKNLKC